MHVGLPRLDLYKVARLRVPVFPNPFYRKWLRTTVFERLRAAPQHAAESDCRAGSQTLMSYNSPPQTTPPPPPPPPPLRPPKMVPTPKVRPAGRKNKNLQSHCFDHQRNPTPNTTFSSVKVVRLTERVVQIHRGEFRARLVVLDVSIGRFHRSLLVLGAARTSALGAGSSATC